MIKAADQYEQIAQRQKELGATSDVPLKDAEPQPEPYKYEHPQPEPPPQPDPSALAAQQQAIADWYTQIQRAKLAQDLWAKTQAGQTTTWQADELRAKGFEYDHARQVWHRNGQLPSEAMAADQAQIEAAFGGQLSADMFYMHNGRFYRYDGQKLHCLGDSIMTEWHMSAPDELGRRVIGPAES